MAEVSGITVPVRIEVEGLRFEYRAISVGSHTTGTLRDNLNDYGQQGFRVVTSIDRYIIMERIIVPEQLRRSKPDTGKENIQ